MVFNNYVQSQSIIKIKIIIQYLFLFFIIGTLITIKKIINIIYNVMYYIYNMKQ